MEFLERHVDVFVPVSIAVSVLAVGVGLRSQCRRYPNADHIIPPILKRRPSFRGYVTSVGDSDNLRIYHLPLCHRLLHSLNLYSIPKSPSSEHTIHIRLSGIDAPEAAHFGNPAQPFSKEAKEFLTSATLHSFVSCKLLKRDHYGRMVASVYYRPRLPFPFHKFRSPLKRHLSLEMVERGFATTYTSGGAEYDGLEHVLTAAEIEARRKGRGQWAMEKKGVRIVRPDEWKKGVRK